MRVAGIDVRPRVDDRDNRLARIVASVVAHLRGARAMTEGAQVLCAVPTVAAQLFGFLHSNFAPESLTTFAQRACSSRSHSPKLSGEPVRTSVPCLAKRSFISARLRIRLSS